MADFSLSGDVDLRDRGSLSLLDKLSGALNTLIKQDDKLKDGFEFRARDNASPVIGRVTSALERVPRDKTTNLGAADEASTVISRVLGSLQSLPERKDVTVHVDGRGVNDALSHIHGGLEGLGGAAVRVGQVMATGLAVGVAGVAAGFGAAVVSATTFEQTMSGVKAVSGATAEQMVELTDKALDLGKKTVFSAAEAATGIEELIKGGVSIEDIMLGAAEATLNLATAGGVDLKSAAEIASNALNQFGLSGRDMAHVSDLIAGAANASSLSVSDFRLSLSQVGAIAHSTNQSIDSTAVAIGVLGAAGIKGSDAGTSLRVMLGRLIPTTNDANAAFAALGLNTGALGNAFLNSNGSFKQFGEIAAILNEKTKGLTNAQKQLTLEMIFGEDAQRAAIILAEAGAVGFDKMASAMGKVTAEAVAAERLKNLAGDLEGLKGSAETFAIVLGSMLTPALRDVTQRVTAFVNQSLEDLQDLKREMDGFKDVHGFDDLSALLATVGQRIGESFGPNAQQLFDTYTSKVGQAFSGLGTAARNAQRLLEELIQSTASISSDTTLGPLEALLAAADQIIEREAGPEAAERFRASTTALGNFADAMGKAGKALVDANLPAKIENIGKALDTADIAGKVNAASTAIQAADMAVKMTGIGGAASENTGPILGLVAALGGLIIADKVAIGVAALSVSLGPVALAILAAGAAIGYMVQNLEKWEIGFEVVTSGDWSSRIASTFNGLREAVLGATGPAGKAFDELGQKANELATVINGVFPGLGAHVSSLGSFARGAADAFGAAVDRILGKIEELKSQVPGLGGIGAALSAVGTTINPGGAAPFIGPIQGPGQSFGPAAPVVPVGDILSQGERLGAALMEGETAGIRNGQPAAETAIREAQAAILAAGADAIGAASPSEEALRRLGLPIPEGIVKGIKQGLPAAKDALGGFLQELLSNTANYAAEYGKFGGAVASALEVGLRDNTPAAGAALARALDKIQGELRSKQIPGWEQLGAELAAAVARAMIEKSPEAKEAALDLIAGAAQALADANSPNGIWQRRLHDLTLLAELEQEMGKAGAKAGLAFLDGLTDPSEKNLGALGNSLQSLIQEAERKGVPEALAVGRRISDSLSLLWQSLDDPEARAEISAAIKADMALLGQGIDAARPEIKSAMDRARDAISESLLSQEFMDRFGLAGAKAASVLTDWLTRGSAEGFDKVAGNIPKAMEAVTAAIQDGVKKGVPGAAQAGLELIAAFQAVFEEKNPEVRQALYEAALAQLEGYTAGVRAFDADKAAQILQEKIDKSFDSVSQSLERSIASKMDPTRRITAVFNQATNAATAAIDKLSAATITELGRTVNDVAGLIDKFLPENQAAEPYERLFAAWERVRQEQTPEAVANLLQTMEEIRRPLLESQLPQTARLTMEQMTAQLEDSRWQQRAGSAGTALWNALVAANGEGSTKNVAALNTAMVAYQNMLETKMPKAAAEQKMQELWRLVKQAQEEGGSNWIARLRELLAQYGVELERGVQNFNRVVANRSGGPQLGAPGSLIGGSSGGSGGTGPLAPISVYNALGTGQINGYPQNQFSYGPSPFQYPTYTPPTGGGTTNITGGGHWSTDPTTGQPVWVQGTFGGGGPTGGGTSLIPAPGPTGPGSTVNLTLATQQFQTILTSFEAFIASTVPTLTDPLRELPAILAPLLREWPVEIQQALQGPLSGFVSQLLGLSPALTAVPGASVNLTAATAALPEILTAFQSFIATTWPTLTDPLRQLPGLLGPLLDDWPPEIQAALQGPLNAFIASFANAAADPLAAVQQATPALIAHIVASLQGMTDPLTQLPADLAVWISQLPPAIQGPLTQFAMTWTSTNAPFLAALQAWGQNNLGFENALVFLSQALEDGLPAFNVAVSSLPQNLQPIITNLQGWLASVIPTLADPMAQLPALIAAVLAPFPPAERAVLEAFLLNLAGVLQANVGELAHAFSNIQMPGIFGPLIAAINAVSVPNNVINAQLAILALPETLRQIANPLLTWLRGTGTSTAQEMAASNQLVRDIINRFTAEGTFASQAMQALLAQLPADVAAALQTILPSLVNPTPQTAPLPGALASLENLFSQASGGQSGTFAFLQQIGQYSGATRGFVQTVVTALAGNSALSGIVNQALAQFAQNPSTTSTAMTALLAQLPANVAAAMRQILISLMPTYATTTPTGATLPVSGIPTNIAQLGAFFGQNSGNQGSAIWASLQQLPQWKDEVLGVIRQFVTVGTLSEATLQQMLQQLPADIRNYLTQFLPGLTGLPTGTTNVPVGGGDGTGVTVAPDAITLALQSIDAKLGPTNKPHLLEIVTLLQALVTGQSEGALLGPVEVRLEQLRVIAQGIEDNTRQAALVNVPMLPAIYNQLGVLALLMQATLVALQASGGPGIGPIFGSAAGGNVAWSPMALISGDGMTPEITVPGPMLRGIGREEGWGRGGGDVHYTIQVQGNARMDQQWFDEMRSLGVKFKQRNGGRGAFE